LFYAARDGQAECIKRMIELDANVNQKDKVNNTALFYGAREGRTEVCRILLENGAEVNVVDHKKQTALYFAKKNGHSETIDLLIDKGAYNTKDGKLKTSDINKLQRQKKARLLHGSHKSGGANNSVSSRGQKSAHNSLSQIKKVLG
jgi:ankyrin repeat protein